MKISEFKKFFKRKIERRKNSFANKLSLIIVSLLSFNLLPINEIITYAATGNSGVGISLVQSNGWDVTAPPITIDGEIAYCLNKDSDFPVNSNYSSGNPYADNRVKSVLYYGYPVNIGDLQGQYGVNNEQARYYTQVALWVVTDQLGQKSYPNVPYLQELIIKGINQNVPFRDFSASPRKVEAKQFNGYQETEVINTTGANGIFTFPSDSNVWSVDINGNKKNNFNVGESFKVRAINGFNGEKNIKLTTTLNKPAALRYNSTDGKQDLVKHFMDPIRGNANINIKFNGTGKIVLTKTDDLGNVLPGVKFGLFTDATATNKIKEVVTGQDGRLEFTDVVAGKYYIKELETLNSHILNSEIKEVTVNGGDTQTVNYTNNIIKGQIRVVKVDEETGEKLQGAEFELVNKANGQSVEKLITGVDGTATSRLHPYGEYILKEVKAPNKYVLNGQEHLVTINQNLETIEVTHQNMKIKGRVEIHKEDSEIAGLKLAGAVFGIFDGETLITEITTNEEGYAISGLINYGDYKMRETKAPEGYQLNDKEWDIQIREDQKTYTYNITNDVIKGKVQIVKLDSKNAEKPVEGAEFDIISENIFGIEKGTVVDTITTDKDGFAFTKDLRRGDYYAIEKSVSDDYWLNTNKYPISITENGKVVVKHIKNEPVEMKIRVIKTDGETKTPIKNVKFKIVDEATGEDIKFKEFFGIIPYTKNEFKTDNNGEIVFPQNLKAGDYSLVETEGAEGYNLIEPIKFTIARDTKYEEIELLGKVHTLEVENTRIKGDMELIKLDADSKEPLTGVEFKIEALNGFDKGTTWNLTTNEEGKIKQTFNYGKYQATEIKTLEGYVLNSEPIFFEVKENGQKIELEMENKRIKGDIELLKIDKDTQKPLKDVEFKIESLNSFDKGKTWTFTTNEEGKISLKDFNYGKYQATEIKTKEEYILNNTSIPFEISEDGELIELTATNKVKEGEVDFSKIDVSTGKAIDGANIIITGLDYNNDHIKLEFVSSKENNRFKLPVGKYEFKETIAPEGFVLNEEVGIFEVKENEVVKVELKNERITGTLEFSKTDVTTGKAIDGAEIKIECVEGFQKGEIIEFTSSKEGNKFELQYGKYKFYETMAPEGYEKTTEVGELEIKENGEIVKAELKNERITGTLEFSKIDVSTGKAIDGAHIKIECIEGFNKGAVIEFVSSKDGNKFELQYGKYKFYETAAPEGYEKTAEVGEFEIKENGEIVKAELKNERITGILEFSKIDVSTGKAIDGAHIKIECIEGFNKGDVTEFVSSKEGNKFELQYGKYKFYETAAPEGYEKTTEVGEFEITESGQIVKAELKNERIKKDIPNTGDSSLVALLGLLLITSLGGIVFLMKNKIK